MDGHTTNVWGGAKHLHIRQALDEASLDSVDADIIDEFLQSDLPRIQISIEQA